MFKRTVLAVTLGLTLSSGSAAIAYSAFENNPPPNALGNKAPNALSQDRGSVNHLNNGKQYNTQQRRNTLEGRNHLNNSERYNGLSGQNRPDGFQEAPTITESVKGVSKGVKKAYDVLTNSPD